MKKTDQTDLLVEQKRKRDLVSRNSKTLDNAINRSIVYLTELVDCFFCKNTDKLGYHFYDERRKMYIALVTCQNCGYITEHRLDILVPCTRLKLKMDDKWG